MTGKRVAILTLGCKVNQYDSAALAGAFLAQGYELVATAKNADICVVNTCSVTHLADRKSRQLLRRSVKANPAAIVVAAGCYAQTAPEEVLELPGVDLVYGVTNLAELTKLLEGWEKDKLPKQAVRSLDELRGFEESDNLPELGRTRAFLKIQDGCDNFCTYCIVPHARGRARSRTPERVIALAGELVAAGYREIVLTGVHIGAYGRDLPKTPSLADLLRSLIRIPGIERIRLGSVEPHDITLDLVEVLSGSSILCRHLHIPLQSGSAAILQRMGRRYTPGEYQKLIAALKTGIPGLGLTTDVIVGFPGETTEYFEQTYDLLSKCSFSKLHVFKYSPRTGTPAADYGDQVPAAVKEERSTLLLALGDQMAADFAKSMVGQVLNVLVEGKAKENPKLQEGLTDNYLRVLFPTTAAPPGAIHPMKITGAQGQTLLVER